MGQASACHAPTRPTRRPSRRHNAPSPRVIASPVHGKSRHPAELPLAGRRLLVRTRPDQSACGGSVPGLALFVSGVSTRRLLRIAPTVSAGSSQRLRVGGGSGLSLSSLSLWERVGVRVLSLRHQRHPHPAYGRPLPEGEARSGGRRRTSGETVGATPSRCATRCSRDRLKPVLRDGTGSPKPTRAKTPDNYRGNPFLTG